MTIKLTFYTKNKCGLCEEAKEEIESLRKEYNFLLEEIDIYSDDALLEEYQLKIPVLQVNGKEVAFGRIHKNDILNAINRISNY
jgi:glutaredoxin